MSKIEVTQGHLQNELGNAVSDAIHAAARAGVPYDEACCIAASVAADYARGIYGNRYLKDLAAVVRKRADLPMPMIVGSAKGARQ